MADVNVLLTQALEEVRKINKDEIFLIKDLFKGYEWNRIPHKDRLLLGVLFIKYINDNDCVIKPIEKNTSKQQRYKKTSNNSARGIIKSNLMK
ncbi:single-stranded DNA-binding protein [Anaerocolumna xylanovorans]|uniref:DUF1413 domain-containing protein n=1 Tax=Anaerocolumna xylanovorans DSM 12503 TaxID=1121345 RepID=A0A1M7Y8I4_9FIRM|nr:single-stranded DNA-binding protein [Anaerocolumna xylanovorans]SHO48930.1 protein of unknown function [Anaerocolumna xylanovorans DSM 12503]